MRKNSALVCFSDLYLRVIQTDKTIYFFSFLPIIQQLTTGAISFERPVLLSNSAHTTSFGMIFSRIDIGIETFSPYACANELDQARWTLSESDSDPVPLLGYTRASFLGNIVASILEKKNVAIEVQHADAFAESLKNLAVEGLGIAWLPESTARDAVDRGLLKAAGDNEWSTTLTLSVFALPEKLNEFNLEVWCYLADIGNETGSAHLPG